MKISCQSCQAKYTIADEKVLGKIVKIRCKKCGATIVINGNESGAQTAGSQSGAEAQAFDCAGGAAAPASLPLITIVAPHFLQRILTIFPRTFSSAIVYFALQD